MIPDWIYKKDIAGSATHHRQIREWCRKNIGYGIRAKTTYPSWKLKWYARVGDYGNGTLRYRYFFDNPESLTYFILMWSDENN